MLFYLRNYLLSVTALFCLKISFSMSSVVNEKDKLRLPNSSHFLHSRTKRNTSAPIKARNCVTNKNEETCTKWENYTDCCNNKTCKDKLGFFNFQNNVIIEKRNCSVDLDLWKVCCESSRCFDKKSDHKGNSSHIQTCFSAPKLCKIEYRWKMCISGRNVPPPALADTNKQSKIIAFSIAGVLMVALLGFAGTSISNARKNIKHLSVYTSGSNINYTNSDSSSPTSSSSVLQTTSSYYGLNGKRLINRSILSTIEEEDDVISIATNKASIKKVGSNKKRATSIGSEEHNESSSDTNSYLKEHTHLEIQDLDSLQDDKDDEDYIMNSTNVYCDFPMDDSKKKQLKTSYVICDVHQAPASKLNDSRNSYNSNYTLDKPNSSMYSLPEGALEMPIYDMSSMSMYDVTQTTPVHTIQRRVSNDSYQYMSMPDMSKATLVIPEIDELLTSSDTYSTDSSSSCKYYLN